MRIWCLRLKTWERGLSGACIAAILVLAGCPPPWIQHPAEGKTYYVRNGGDDAADGLSDETAWATLAKVQSSRFNPGDSVLLKCGSVWDEDLAFPSSGSSEADITVSAYGEGDPPLLNQFVLWQQSHVTVSGLSMRADMDDAGTYLYHCDSIVFDRNIVDGQRIMNHNRINIFEVDFCYDTRITNNIIRNGGNHVGTTSGGGLNMFSCHDTLIEGNLAYNHAEVCLQCGSISASPTYNIVFRGNTVYNEDGYYEDCRGINVGSVSHDVIVEKNTVYNTKTFLLATDADTYDVIMRNNVLYYSLDSGASTFVLILTTPHTGNNSGTRVYNNSMFHTSAVSGGAFIFFNTMGGRISNRHEIYNNLMLSYNPLVYFIEDAKWDDDDPNPPSSEFISDYNLFYSMNPYGAFRYRNIDSSTPGEWTLQSGLDSHSLYENPLMAGIQGWDQRSVTGSEIVTNPSFDSDTNGWSCWFGGAAAGTFSRTTTAGEYFSSPAGAKVQCSSSGMLHSDIQLGLEYGAGFAISAQKWYVLSFKARASAAFKIHSTVMVQKGTSSSYADAVVGGGAEVTTDWNTEYIFFHTTQSATDAAVIIYLGTTLPAGESLSIDDASFKLADSLNGSPPFISDYATPANSPAVDHGLTLADVTDDFLGNPRPAGAAYDIGAYEH